MHGYTWCIECEIKSRIATIRKRLPKLPCTKILTAYDFGGDESCLSSTYVRWASDKHLTVVDVQDKWQYKGLKEFGIAFRQQDLRKKCHLPPVDHIRCKCLLCEISGKEVYENMNGALLPGGTIKLSVCAFTEVGNVLSKAQDYLVNTYRYTTQKRGRNYCILCKPK
ncbi:hypothetical protein LCGC14_2651430 [marine sediment metagenome]|uniref:Uncharacterized protein n=1 Tax=marine sediment metagenome TaxID=412755 RepID=A0A0F8ZUQ6_9ZZZZ